MHRTADSSNTIGIVGNKEVCKKVDEEIGLRIIVDTHASYT